MIRARLCSPLVTTAAAAPSPNKAVATIAAGSSLSRRIEIEQVSTVTNSQLLPGSAAARRAASDRPLTPPAQPRPNTGTRRMSGRKPTLVRRARVEARRGDARGRDGDDAVDLLGREAGFLDRRAAPPRRTGSRRLPDRPRCDHASRGWPSYQSGGATSGAWRSRHCRTRPTGGRTAPSSRRTRRARGPWLPPGSMTCGGTAVASESRLQGRIVMLLSAVEPPYGFA